MEHAFMVKYWMSVTTGTAHIWDDATAVKRISLKRIVGYLFLSDGTPDQEFESIFDLRNGTFLSGSVRYADGTTKQL
jgi:hypothetical protein